MMKDRGSILGIDLGGTNVRIGRVDHNNNLVYKKYKFLRSEDSEKEIFENIVKNINMFMPKNEFQKLKGIGISSAAIMKDGKVLYWPNNTKWNGIDLGEILKDFYNIPIIYEDDANSAAVGEFSYLRKNEINTNSMIFITLGTGIGCGVILNGRLYKGESGNAGELGHIKVAEIPRCKCGNNGCLQTVFSSTNILDDYGKYTGILSDRLEEIQFAYYAGIDGAKKVIDKYATILSTTFYNLSLIWDINDFVLGGGVSKILPMLACCIEEKVNNLLKSHYKSIRIANSVLGEWGGVYGALVMIGRKVYGGENYYYNSDY